ncbi:DUF1833 family protein [Pseudomonas sp. NBRC 111132]|uniref:DUF1833 family protein n=1 Tax=Pseudomonas sp. NBRC 111132 TaxID=1661047 RepID=UPI000761056D|nr:DUF1833 family protein [Pseudomonas sp. NBRC 111132]
MDPLEVAFASPSGAEVLIPALELTSNAWAEPVLLTHMFTDITAVDEVGRVLTYEAGGIDVSMPKKDNTGSQAITFAIDGVTGKAQGLVKQAIDQEEVVRLTMRLYLSTDLSKPARRPYYMKVGGGKLEVDHVEVQAKYFDLITIKFPRDDFNSQTAPCIKYEG